jgi:pyruvate dehydrogenase E2 component (dihydrolipoamide acetyltransferase)
MPFTVAMPKLSPTMEEGTIAKWHKKVGDRVKAGELLIEVVTDKATIEYQALDDGYLRQILVGEGKKALVNQAIAVFSLKPDESIAGFQIAGPMPEPMKEEVSKETLTVQAIVAPAPVQAMQQPRFAPEPPLENYRFEFPNGNIAERVLASPLAKKIAQEKGLDLTTVKGSGPRGRIVSRDLPLAQQMGSVTFGRREVPDAPPGSYEEILLTPMRKVIGQRLQESKSFIPHFYLRQEIDAAPLFDIREQLKLYDINPTVNDYIIRAVALALREHPMINSGFNSVNQSIILFKTVDIAVAVSMKEGLITPIIRHADYKNIGEISVEMKDLSVRSKTGALEVHEYKGGSFTVSNLGMFKISEFFPIINPPQSAILGVGGMEECVRIRMNGKTFLGKKMNLTLAIDHRVVDGVEASQFIKTLQKYLENPAVLLI